MSVITPGQKVAELLRELSTRRRVYPLWIQLRKITQADAEHRMAVIVALIEDIYTLYPHIRPQPYNEPTPPCHLDRF